MMELMMFLVLLGFAILGGPGAERRRRHGRGLFVLAGIIALPFGVAAAVVLGVL